MSMLLDKSRMQTYSLPNLLFSNVIAEASYHKVVLHTDISSHDRITDSSLQVELVEDENFVRLNFTFYLLLYLRLVLTLEYAEK